MERTSGLIVQVESENLSVEDDGASNKMDEYHPLGKISSKLVRLSVLDRKDGKCFFS